MRTIETMIQACRKAILSGKPILVLETDEIEIIREIIRSDSLVVRLSGVKHQNRSAEASGKQEPEAVPAVFQESSSDSVRDFNIRYHAEDQENFDFDCTWGSNSLQLPYLHILTRFPAGDGLARFIDEYERGDSPVSASVVLIFGTDVMDKVQDNDTYFSVPERYREYCEVIGEPYPDADEILKLLEENQEVFSCISEIGESYIKQLTEALSGLHLYRIKRIIASLSVLPSRKSEIGVPVIGCPDEALEEIQRNREQLLKAGGLLELYKPSGGGIRGMDSFTRWFKREKDSILNAGTVSRESGAGRPKGILLCGVPGCGKSEAVNHIAKYMPVVTLDIGRLMGKYVGQSEHNMDRALKMAEAMAPVVLFIDELDKSFSDAGSNNEGSGYFRRMFGQLLTWMQKCDKMCYIFATANDISRLPKEFFRSGRFDSLFSVFMPTASECAAIMKYNMETAQNREGSRIHFTDRCLEDRELKEIINELFPGRFVTGADIHKLVNMSLRQIWREGPEKGRIEVTTEKWEAALRASLDETTVYGEGEDNLNSIALCCIRLLRNNFRNVSAHPMFSYQAKMEAGEKGSGIPCFRVSLKYTESEWEDAYDKALAKEIGERIRLLAPGYEREEYARKL